MGNDNLKGEGAYTMSEREKLKKRLENIEKLRAQRNERPKEWTRTLDDTLHAMYMFASSEVAALLSELEQAERERDSGERFRSQMEKALGCDTSGGKIWFGTGLLSRAETLVEREAALRTLREASANLIESYSCCVCCDWCGGKKVSEQTINHAPECEFVLLEKLAAALAAEGGK